MLQQSSTAITTNCEKDTFGYLQFVYLQSIQCISTGETEQFLSIVIVHPSKLPGGGCEEQLMLVMYSEISLSGTDSIVKPTTKESNNF